MKGNVAAPALLAILSLIWGSSFILIKYALEEVSPLQVAGIRIASAFLFLLPFAIWRLKAITKKNWFYILSIGLFGSGIPAILFAYGQQTISSSNAGILNSLTPFFTFLVGVIMFRSPFIFNKLLGVVIGFAGAVLISFSSGNTGFSFHYSSFLLIAATLMYGINVNVIKYKLPELPALTITSLSFLFVGPIALVWVLYSFNEQNLATLSSTQVSSIWAAVLLGVVSTALALLLFNRLIKFTTPVYAASVTYFIPIVALLWGFFDGESLYTNSVLGMLLILAGVYLANRPSKRKQVITSNPL